MQLTDREKFDKLRHGLKNLLIDNGVEYKSTDKERLESLEAEVGKLKTKCKSKKKEHILLLKTLDKKGCRRSYEFENMVLSVEGNSIKIRDRDNAGSVIIYTDNLASYTFEYKPKGSK